MDPLTLEGAAKYLVAIIKKNDDGNAEKIVQEKLKELMNGEIDSLIEIVQGKEDNWKSVSVRCNIITRDIRKQMTERKI